MGIIFAICNYSRAFETSRDLRIRRLMWNWINALETALISNKIHHLKIPLSFEAARFLFKIVMALKFDRRIKLRSNTMQTANPSVPRLETGSIYSPPPPPPPPPFFFQIKIMTLFQWGIATGEYFPYHHSSRGHSVYAPSQWETVLQCNAVAVQYNAVSQWVSP